MYTHTHTHTNTHTHIHTWYWNYKRYIHACKYNYTWTRRSEHWNIISISLSPIYSQTNSTTLVNTESKSKHCSIVFSVEMDLHLIFGFEALRLNQSPLPWRIRKTRLASLSTILYIYGWYFWGTVFWKPGVQADSAIYGLTMGQVF